MSNPDIFDVDRKDKLLGIKGLKLAGKAYAGSENPKDCRVSPIYGDLCGLPKVYLLSVNWVQNPCLSGRPFSTLGWYNQRYELSKDGTLSI